MRKIFTTIISLFFCITAFAATIESSKPNSQVSTYLIMQTAKSGELQLDKSNGTYKLVLNNVEPELNYIVHSKTGNHAAGQMNNAVYYQSVGNSNLANNKNREIHSVLLSVKNKDNAHIKLFIVLKEPEYNASKHQLTFKAAPMLSDAIKKDYATNSPQQFGHVTLLSDGGGICGRDCIDWP